MKNQSTHDHQHGHEQEHRHADRHHEHAGSSVVVAEPQRDANIDGDSAGGVFTCPMHPQIRRDAPGNCPICGMALEPVMPALDEGESPELVNFRRRFWVTLPLTIIVTGLAMGAHQFVPEGLPYQNYIELGFSKPLSYGYYITV